MARRNLKNVGRDRFRKTSTSTGVSAQQQIKEAEAQAEKPTRIISELAPVAVYGIEKFRRVIGQTTTIESNSVPVMRMRNRVTEGAMDNFPARHKKAELVLLMHLTRGEIRQLSSPSFRGTDTLLNNLVNKTLMKYTKIPLRQGINQKQTASQFASEGATLDNEVYGNEYYQEELQIALADAFLSL